jgi:putative SOS response-associated peptidase YedK
MIITEPNEFVAEVHDRMPVLLQLDQFDHWLSGNMTVEELKPVPLFAKVGGIQTSEQLKSGYE